MPEPMWMVRAGEGGYLIDAFRQGVVAVGWSAIGDLTSTNSRDAIRAKYMTAYPNEKAGAMAAGVGVLYKFRKAPVKHRPRSQMGSQEVRSFVGCLRSGDRALYVSTGGFSKEAKYEAERSNFPITLLNLDDLASLIVTHYERFDTDGRVLLPLTKVYFPAE